MGSFSAQSSAAVNSSFSGVAAFGTSDDVLGTGEEAFVLSLENDEGSRAISLLRDSAGRLGPDTYTIGEYLASPLQGKFIVREGTDIRFFYTGTGTLTITSSAAQSLQGTLSFTAIERFGSGEVQVNATFNAMCFPTGAFNCE